MNRKYFSGPITQPAILSDGRFGWPSHAIRMVSALEASRWVYNRMVKRAFNRWSRSYEASVVPMLERRGYSYVELASEIAGRLRVEKYCTIVELGVGSGVLGTEVFEQLKCDIIGLDISEGMLKYAINKNVYVALFNGTAESLPFANESIDGLYTSFMMHSVMMQRDSLSEIYRVLRHDACAIVVDLCPAPSRPSLWQQMKSNLHSIRREYGAPSRYRTTEEYVRMMTDVGFDIWETKQLGKKKDYTHFLFHIRKR